MNTVSNRRLDALEDFQSLYKTDADIFPLLMVKSLVDSLPEAERLQVSERPISVVTAVRRGYSFQPIA